jgi:hypothetical protein
MMKAQVKQGSCLVDTPPDLALTSSVRIKLQVSGCADVAQCLRGTDQLTSLRLKAQVRQGERFVPPMVTCGNVTET